ncbi:MAG TPA: hypothetical protein VHP32_11935 [Ignavibacteria bacterium]|nr:hypothetical protein [Ignavibacteria bacterium]
MADNTSSKPVLEKHDKYDLYITIILGLATLCGATAAYFSALWGGELQTSYAQAVNYRQEANTLYLDAANQKEDWEFTSFKDDMFYIQWKESVQRGDPDAAYYFSQLSEEYQKDLTDTTGGETNYEQGEQQRLAELEATFEVADSIFTLSEQKMTYGQEANRNGDQFTLSTVLFTIVLFFGGLAGLKATESYKRYYLIIAAVVFVLSLIKMLTSPFPPL